MHKVYFYKKHGASRSLLGEYMRELSTKTDKDSRIKYNKINVYIQQLRRFGTRAGEPYIKHIKGEIWELRPLKDRILFVSWVNGSYVVLHHFEKKTRKTPPREIEQAERNLADLKERGIDYEK